MNFPGEANSAWRAYERAVDRLHNLDRSFGDDKKTEKTLAAIKIFDPLQTSNVSGVGSVEVAAAALEDAVRPDLNQYVKDVLKAARSDVRAAGERLCCAIERDLKAMGV